MAGAEDMEIALVLDERASMALERIATAMETLAANMGLAMPEAPPICPHPESQREPMPGSTMGNLSYRCTQCGAEGI